MRSFLRSRKGLLLAALFATFVAAGAMDFIVGERPGSGANSLAELDIAIGIVTTLLVALWCFADAAERDATMTRGLTWLIVLLVPLGLLVYLYRTRTGRQLWLALAKTALFALLLVGGEVAGFVTASVFAGD